MITSAQNDRLKQLGKLARRRGRDLAGRFVAEGEDLLAAADQAGWQAVERYCAAGSGLPGVEVEPGLLAEVSQLGSGTRALGVYEQRWAEKPIGTPCVALHGIADPGNVGTIVRSALAFGAGTVALGPGCADPYGHKAVRASMGAIFSIPLTRVKDIDELPRPRVALAAHQGAALHAIDLESEPTLLVGAERSGLPEQMIERCETVCHIPIASESLNAAMAATVALYEVRRCGWEMGA